MQTVYKKILREVGCYKNRTVLTLLGIMIGIFSLGFILSAYTILDREMDRNFMDTNPASIVINISNLDEKGINDLSEAHPELNMEVRKCIQARINRGNGTYGTIYLYGINDFQDLKIDTFTLEKGKFPKNVSEMVLERDAISLLPNVTKGYDEEEVLIKLPGQEEQKVHLSGKVHVPGLSPASMEKYSYGFMSLEGLQALGDKGWYDEVHILWEVKQFNKEQLKIMAQTLEEELTQSGYSVEGIKVPEPGKHPHNDQLQSFLFLLETFTVIALFVACMIVINLINALMCTQKKQMAIMKATGATTWTIAKPYFLYVILMSFTAELVALPLAYMVGSKYADFAAGVLNFNIKSYAVPIWSTSLQILLGVVVTLAAAFYPIYKNAKLTIKEGLAAQEGAENIDGKMRFYKGHLRQNRFNSFNLQSWLKLSLRNTFRKKGRTLFAVVALASGGVIFMTSQNIVASIAQTVSEAKHDASYTYDIKLHGTYSQNELEKVLKNVPEVQTFEIYQSNEASLIAEGDQTARYKVKVFANEAKVLKSIKGTKKKGIQNPIVISQGLLEDELSLKLGEQVVMKIGSQSAKVTIAGVNDEIPPLPYMYMARTDYERLFGTSGEQNLLVYLDKAHMPSGEKQLEIAAKIEQQFNENKIEIAENWNIYLLRQAFADHLKVMINFLSMVAILAIMVGGISMASIIGINVSERKRELGILRAIGAGEGKVKQMMLFEVVTMGIMGWLFSVAMAYPISVLTGNYFGQIFIHTNLSHTVSISGIFIWLGLALVAAIVSGIIPTNEAAHLPLSKMLSYE